MDSVLEKMADDRERSGDPGFAIAAAVVKNNIDLIVEGRVQVRIPTRPSFEPWARLPSIGGSSSRGFLWVPQINDEVLVAFAKDDLSSAYVLGGLWSTTNRTPATTPLDALAKKIIRTGATSALGHEVEFDDVQQSITITTSTKQKLVMSPDKIQMSNIAGSVELKLDNLTQTASITALKEISLTAPQISIKGAKVEISGGQISIQSVGPCALTGVPIKLN